MFQYLAAGAGVVALGLGITTLVQHNKIEDLEAAKTVLESRVADKDATLEAQNAGVAALQTEAEAAGAALKAAGDRTDALTAELAAERSKRNAAVEKDYALPDCQALLATDIAAICPAHAARIRIP